METGKSFIEQQHELNKDDEITDNTKTKKPINFGQLIRDRRTRLFLCFLVFSLSIPILLFYFIIDRYTYENDTSYTCSIEFSYQVPIGQTDVTRKDCDDIAACFNNFFNSCYHSIPAKYNYFKKVQFDSSDNTYRPSQSITPFKNATLPELKLTLMEVDENKLKVIVHTPNLLYEEKRVSNKKYRIKVAENQLGVEVFRAESEELLFTTFRGPLIASNGYWEWSFQLIGEKLYGLGEIVIKDNETISKVIYKNRHEHNALPIFMVHRKGSFHGVVVEHNGPLEVTVLPSKLVVLRILAGDKIEITFSTGPTPRDVVTQQRIYDPIKPPYWLLGAHICRDGLTTLKQALDEYINFDKTNTIQYASDCIHENLYDMLNQETANHNLEEIVQNLKEKSRLLLSIPPQILISNTALYEKALKLDLLYKNATDDVFIGTYLAEDAAYPDFSHELIGEWFTELKQYISRLNADGFVLKDNWPAEENYIFENDNYTFPYITEVLNTSLSKTMPWNTFNTNGTEHVLVHNQYGKSQVEVFKNNIKYDILLTNSYDYGLPEPAYLNNINISWMNLKAAISTTLYHSIFGNPLISIPICGSTSHYDKKLHEKICLRWYLTAVTMPLFRISSDKPRRDPLSLESAFAQNIVRNALKMRYMLLPYYHSTLNNGEPLVRPMFYDFYVDNETLSLDEQYMVGDALLIAQPLLPDTSQIAVYLPPITEVWYEFWGGRPYKELGWININIVESDWIMFIAQGKIVPLRNNKNPIIGSTSSEDTLGLAIALNCDTTSCIAEGSLSLATTSLKFSATKKGVTVSNIKDSKNDLGCNNSNEHHHPTVIENALIYGIENIITNYELKAANLCKIMENECFISFQ